MMGSGYTEPTKCGFSLSEIAIILLIALTYYISTILKNGDQVNLIHITENSILRSVILMKAENNTDSTKNLLLIYNNLLLLLLCANVMQKLSE